MICFHNECQIDLFAQPTLYQRMIKPLVAHTPQQRTLASSARQAAVCGFKPSSLRIHHAVCFFGHSNQPPPRVRDHL